MASPVSPIEIQKHLPKTNCKKCGHSTCMAFAIKLLKEEAYIDECPVLKEAKYIRENIALKEILSKVFKAKETNLIVHEDLCNGCGDCVVSCPVNVSTSLDVSGGKGASTDEVILKMKDGKVEVVNLKLCRRFSEDGDENGRPCRICIDSCPLKAIEFM